MNTCACCGQIRKPDGRPIVKVDDALLALCNEAYANAEARSSGDVLIADLVWCIARSPRWSADIDAGGMPAGQLAVAAEAAMMRRASRGRDGGPVSTCADLKTLLRRAERRALDTGRPAADVSDFLHALFSEAGDLKGADFVHQAFDATRRFETIDRSRDDRSWERSPPWRSSAYPDFRSSDSLGARSPSFALPREVATPPPADTGIEMLRGRLSTQEHQCADLRRKSEALAHQVQSLSARMARMTELEHRAERNRAETDAWLEARLNAHLAERSGVETALRSEVMDLSRRLEAQDQQIAELQRLADALAHQSATVTARLSQASELGRAQSEVLAELQRRLRESETHRSERSVRRRQPGSARSRLRRSRRRNLWLRLRQRRRTRMGPERAKDRRRLWQERGKTSGSAQIARPDPARTEPHAAPPLAVHPERETERFEAFPRPYLESSLPGPLKDSPQQFLE